MEPLRIKDNTPKKKEEFSGVRNLVDKIVNKTLKPAISRSSAAKRAPIGRAMSWAFSATETSG